MKRTSPLRRTPLRPGRPPTRGTPLRTRSGPSKRFAQRRDPAYCARIRTHPCLIGASCSGRIECAHVVSRGAGGDDRGNTVPLCTRHHREQHRIGVTSFARRYGLDLAFEATVLAGRSDEQEGR